MCIKVPYPYPEINDPEINDSEINENETDGDDLAEKTGVPTLSISELGPEEESVAATECTVSPGSVSLPKKASPHILSSSWSQWALFLTFLVHMFKYVQRKQPITPPPPPRERIVIVHQQADYDYTEIENRYGVAIRPDQQQSRERVYEPTFDTAMSPDQRERLRRRMPELTGRLDSNSQLSDDICRKVSVCRSLIRSQEANPNILPPRPNPMNFNVTNANRATANPVRNTRLGELSRAELVSGLLSKIVFERDAMPDIGNLGVEQDTNYAPSRSYLKYLVSFKWDNPTTVAQEAHAQHFEAHAQHFKVEVLRELLIKHRTVGEVKRLKGPIEQHFKDRVLPEFLDKQQRRIPQEGFSMSMSSTASSSGGPQGGDRAYLSSLPAARRTQAASDARARNPGDAAIEAEYIASSREVIAQAQALALAREEEGAQRQQPTRGQQPTRARRRGRTRGRTQPLALAQTDFDTSQVDPVEAASSSVD